MTLDQSARTPRTRHGARCPSPDEGSTLVAATPRHPDLPALTGLRGLLALWVVVYHAAVGLELRGADLTAHAPLAVVTLARSGSLAVEMFFVLSGLVMVHAHGRDFVTADAPPRWIAAAVRFLWLRLIRLWPVHAVVIAMYAGLVVSGFDWPVTTCGNPANRAADCNRFDVTDLPAQLLLVAGWGPAPVFRWNFVSWSISAEWLAYVAFPILVLATARTPAPLAGPLALVVLSAGVPFLVWLGPTFHGLSDAYSAVRVLPGFLAGCLIGQMRAATAVTTQLYTTMLTVVAATAFVMVTVATSIPMYAVVPGALLVLALAVERPRGLGAALAVRPLQALGRMSYSLYVSHFLVLELLARTRPGRLLPASTLRLWLTILAAVALCVAVGALLHRLVEEPARRRMRTIGATP